MKKIIATIICAMCMVGFSFAEGLNIDAGIAIDYSDGYDGIAFGGTVDFDYVFPANVALFSNTDFTFASGSPNFAIAEILGVGYRFTLTDKLYLQAGAGLGIVFFDHDVDDVSGADIDGGSDTMYGNLGPALAVKLGIKFTDMVGMNVGLDAIIHPVNIFKDNDDISLDPESGLSIIPKVCFVVSF